MIHETDYRPGIGAGVLLLALYLVAIWSLSCRRIRMAMSLIFVALVLYVTFEFLNAPVVEWFE